MKDREITEEEKTQAREFFAKIEIYQDEYEQKAKSGQLPKEFQRQDRSAGQAPAGPVPRPALFRKARRKDKGDGRRGR